MNWIPVFLLLTIVSPELFAFKKLRKLYKECGLKDYEINNAKNRYDSIFNDLDDQLDCEGLLEENLVSLILNNTGLKNKFPDKYEQLEDDLHLEVRSIIEEYSDNHKELGKKLKDWLEVNLIIIAVI